MAAISIIVPIYNVEKYLEKCLESLATQTFEDIEIICINDASTDLSESIAANYVSKDRRFRLINHKRNMGTSQARKHGVEVSSGDYILFVDSDDWLEPFACEYLYETMKREQVDILQYGTNVIPAAPMSEEMLTWINNFLRPFEMRVEGSEILNKCFVEDKFDFNITDKMWNGDICRKAFSEIENSHIVAAEDRYAFFVMAFYSRSYLGLCDAKFYNYNVGVGITGGDTLDLQRFENRCSGVETVRCVRRFLDQKKAFEQLSKEYEQFENKLLWDVVDCWYNKLDATNYGKGYDLLIKYWGAEKIVPAIARVYFEQEKEIQKRTSDSCIYNGSNVAIYFRNKTQENMEETILEQVNMLNSLGHSVIILLDMDTQINVNKHILNGREFVRLPSSTYANWGKYSKRAEQLCKELIRRDIECVFYGSPTSHIAWLDILLIRSMGLRVYCMNEQSTNFAGNDASSLDYRVGNLILKIPRKIKRMLKK